MVPSIQISYLHNAQYCLSNNDTVDLPTAGWRHNWVVCLAGGSACPGKFMVLSTTLTSTPFS